MTTLMSSCVATTLAPMGWRLCVLGQQRFVHVKWNRSSLFLWGTYCKNTAAFAASLLILYGHRPVYAEWTPRRRFFVMFCWKLSGNSSEPKEGAIGAEAPPMVLQNTQNIPQIHTVWSACSLNRQKFCAFGAILYFISAVFVCGYEPSSEAWQQIW